MRLKKLLWGERIGRVTARAQLDWLEPASPIIELSQRPPTQDRVLPAGSSRICGTWADRPLGRRRSQRVTVVAEVSVRRTGRFPFHLPLGDISTTGCKVELVDFIESSDRVIARFPGLEAFGATVAWVENNFAGLTFDRPMHPAVFEQLLSRFS